MIALTDGQALIFAVVILIAVVLLLVDGALKLKEPPLPKATRRLKQELEKHRDYSWDQDEKEL